MFRNEKTTDSKQLFSYYEMLWFTKEQCQILSLFEFNDRDLIEVIRLYNESSLKLKWLSFVKSLSDFIDFYCSNKDMWCDTKYEEYNWKMYKIPNDSQRCPKCGSSMVLRKRKRDWKVFWWCINYDEWTCNWWRDFVW